MMEMQQEFAKMEKCIAAAYDALPCGVVWFTAREEIRVSALNRTAREALGEGDGSRSLARFLDFIHAADREQVQKLFAARRQATATIRFRNRRGELFTAAFLLWPREEAACFCGVFVPLTADRTTQLTELPYADWDLQRRSVRYSADWEKTMRVACFSPYAAAVRDRTGLAALFRRAARSDGATYRLRRVSGETLWCRVRTQLFFDAAGGLARAVFAFIDVTREKLAQQRLREELQRDPLTRFYNKAATESRIRSCMKKSAGCLQALLFIDIDNFKAVNDTLGHWQGDVVLREFAARIGALFRADDIVGRVGGDEFMVFLRGEAAAQAEAKARRILAVTAEIREAHAPTCPISASVGIVSFVMAKHAFADVYRAADRALYEAKRRGKAGYCSFRRIDADE